MPPARKNTPKESVASAAGDRVRAIIEAAEASAADIRAEAEAEAQQVRAQAEARASSLRSEARSDFRALLASIRDGVERLQTDLERLEKSLAEPEPEEPVSAVSAAESAPPASSVPAASDPVRRDEPVGAPLEEDVDLAIADEDDPDAAVAEDAAAAGPVDEPAPDEVLAESTPSPAESDLEGARLVALNMALEGKSRDEVGRYLREHYDLADREALLDEVYALVGD